MAAVYAPPPPEPVFVEPAVAPTGPLEPLPPMLDALVGVAAYAP